MLKSDKQKVELNSSSNKRKNKERRQLKNLEWTFRVRAEEKNEKNVSFQGILLLFIIFILTLFKNTVKKLHINQLKTVLHDIRGLLQNERIFTIKIQTYEEGLIHFVIKKIKFKTLTL